MSQINLDMLPVVRQGAEAAMLDLGDGIACLRFQSKGNSISPPVKDFILEVLLGGMDGFDGLVIGSQDKNFSVGASLFVMKENLDKRDYAAFDRNVRSMQAVTSALQYTAVPVVAAPYRRVLGGGLEVALHCRSRVALTDCRMGLVEAGVGLIPAGGGTKACALRVASAREAEQDRARVAVFDQLLLRRVSADAAEAGTMGYLSPKDPLVAQESDLLAVAKAHCLSLVKAGWTRREPSPVTLPGAPAYRGLKQHMEHLLEREEITAYDAVVGDHLARILAGSDTAGPCPYSENQLLDMEREAFVDLARQGGTYARITYFTQHNTLLRN